MTTASQSSKSASGKIVSRAASSEDIARLESAVRESFARADRYARWIVLLTIGVVLLTIALVVLTALLLRG